MRRAVNYVFTARQTLINAINATVRASPWNIATIAIFIFIVITVLLPAFDWLIARAVWDAEDAAACRTSEGACWAFVATKYRFILFGLYPYEQQWRPMLSVLIVILMLIFTCLPRMWSSRLVGMWVTTIVICGILMWGGVFGLPYVSDDLWGGLPLTLILAVLGIAGSFPLSIILALGRRSTLPIIRAACVGFIELIRGVPLISVLFMASVMFPLFLPEGVSIDKLLRAQLGIIMFTAAYLAEAVRGGLQSVPRGQYEAADALGFGYWRSMQLVVLPQALKASIPALVNQFISMFKDTSLVVVIGLYDLLNTAKTALSDPEWRPFFIESYLFVATIYWIFCYSMSKYSRTLELRLGVGKSVANKQNAPMHTKEATERYER
jgi:general L-amino acid transport system permease protein